MPTDVETTAQTQPNAGQDMYCVNCDYNLRGLPSDGACPECGALIARTLAAPTYRRVNHRWLAQMQIALWLLLAVSLLTVFWSVLSFAGSWYFSYTRSLLYWRDFYPQALIGMLQLVAIWMLTMPEPGPPRSDSPRTLAAWARWLCVASHAIPMLRAFAMQSALASGMFLPGILISQTAASAGAAAVICLLLMLRQYARRNADAKVATRLGLAAAIGCGVALLSIAPAVWFILSPDWFSSAMWFLPVLALAALGYSAVWIRAVTGFALRLTQASRRQRRRLRLGKTLAMIASALLVGAAAGAAAAQVLEIQIRQAGNGAPLAAMMPLCGWLWRVGLIVGIALLPSRLAIFYRMWSRSRH